MERADFDTEARGSACTSAGLTAAVGDVPGWERSESTLMEDLAGLLMLRAAAAKDGGPDGDGPECDDADRNGPPPDPCPECLVAFAASRVEAFPRLPDREGL